MSNRLEQFVRDHRDDFDSEEPDNKLWEKIRMDVTPGKKKQGILVRPGRAGVAAAAAVVLVAVGLVWYFNTRNTPETPGYVQQTPPAKTSPETATTKPLTTVPTDSVKQANNEPTLASIRPKTREESPSKTEELENTMGEEMYHYAKLVEIKHNQLRTIQKDEPLLYKQFAADVYKLDSVYHSLQDQLPNNPNREQLLEAMLQNLQLQMGLLNHQLDIIKQINHSKKTAYEEAHKTA